MLQPLNSVKQWIASIPLESSVLKLCATMPVVNTIVLVIKERELLKGYRQVSANTTPDDNVKQERQLSDALSLNSTICRWGVLQLVTGIALSILMVNPAPFCGTAALQFWHLSSYMKLRIERTDRALANLEAAQNGFNNILNIFDTALANKPSM